MIFGWGYVTRKLFGPTIHLDCPNCHNVAWFHLTHIRVWFTLFFIPVIPYESKHMLTCQICSQGWEMKGPQLAEAKRMNEIASAFLAQKMSAQEYVAQASSARLWT